MVGSRGWRNRFYATDLPRWAVRGCGSPYPAATAGSERDFLKAQADQLRSELSAIEQRLNELSSADKV
jgi:hypothetical protein